MDQENEKIKRLEDLLKTSYRLQSDDGPSPRWRSDLMRAIRTSSSERSTSDLLEQLIWRFATTGAAAAFALVLVGLRIGEGASSGFAAFDPVAGIDVSDDVDDDDDDDIDLWDIQS